MTERLELPPVPDRYSKLDELNRSSWYMNDANRPFSVVMSVSTAGKPRDMYNVFHGRDELTEAKKAANRLSRIDLAGNMSPALDPAGHQYGPQLLSEEDRLAYARQNMERFIGPEHANVDPASIRVLFPDRDYSTGLQVVDVDHDPATYNGVEPARLNGRGDMIYTYNPNIVFGVRPADCPLVVLSAETPKGRVYTMTHFAWQGAAVGQLGDMQHALEGLGVDLETAAVYITPGGQAETFPYENTDLHPHDQYPGSEGLFANIQRYEKNGHQKFAYTIDTPKYVYDGLLAMGLEPRQIFVDTSDTTAPESGLASHSRSSRLDEDNNRDFVLVRLEAGESRIASNPDRPTPPEIAWQIVPLDVEYVDFTGEVRKGTIEVNRDLYDDVKDFFALAHELRFPIDAVVRSSDPEYGWDDDKLMAANTSSGFNFRFIKGTDRPSLHGLGRAFDVNTKLNPYIRYEADGSASVDPPDGSYDPDKPGTLTADHPLVLMMKERGWVWGGDWQREVAEDGTFKGRTDYQHFEKAAEV